MSDDIIVDKRVHRSKAAFKKALIALLKGSPLPSITVTDIIKQSGYSRAAFYSYYKNKSDFLTSIFNEEVQNYVDIIYDTISKRNGILLESTTYEPALNFFEYVYENRELYRFILSSNLPGQNLDSFCGKAYNEFIKKIDIELFKETPSFDIDFYFYCYTYLYMIFIKYWIKSDFKYSPKYMANQVAILNTLRVSKVKPKNPVKNLK